MSAVVLLAATVAMAHTSVADDHMGEAAAMCLAVLAGGAAVAALPALGRLVAQPRAPLRLGALLTPARAQHAAPYEPRGDPALLQVFRR